MLFWDSELNENSYFRNAFKCFSFLVTVMQISLDSICPWVIFIIKPQMYYKANCNIYNPKLMTTSQFFFFLGVKSTEIQCDVKMKIFLFIWVWKSLTSESYTILKYFLWMFVILYWLWIREAGNIWCTVKSEFSHPPVHRKHVCNILKNTFTDATGISSLW